MKNDNLPYMIKAFLSTALLVVLTLNAKHEMPKQKQHSKQKSKLSTFSTISGMPPLQDVYNISYMLSLKQTTRPSNSLFATDSSNTIIVNPVKENDTKQKQSIATKKNITTEKETTISNDYGVKIVVGKKSVKYIYADGSIEIREGGTLAWRNKNPGALRGGVYSVGRANRFAVFASEEDGIKSLKALLRGEHYRDLTLKAAIFKYAPPHENNTSKYQSDLKRLTGLDLELKLRDLTDEEMNCVVKTIKKLEGWVPGKITYIESVKDKQMQILDTLKQRTL